MYNIKLFYSFTLDHNVFNNFVLQKSRVGSKRCVNPENARPREWTAIGSVLLLSLIQNLVHDDAIHGPCQASLAYFCSLKFFLWRFFLEAIIRYLAMIHCKLIWHHALYVHLVLIKHDWLDWVIIHRLESSKPCKYMFLFFSRLICPPTTSAYCFTRTAWFNIISACTDLSGLCSVLRCWIILQLFWNLSSLSFWKRYVLVGCIFIYFFHTKGN